MLMFVECMVEIMKNRLSWLYVVLVDVIGLSVYGIWCYMILWCCMNVWLCIYMRIICVYIYIYMSMTVYDCSIVVYALVHRLNTLATFNLTSKVIDEDFMLHRLQSSLGASLGCAIHLEICWDVFFPLRYQWACVMVLILKGKNRASNGMVFKPIGKSSSRCTFMSLSPCRCLFFQKQKPHLPTLW